MISRRSFLETIVKAAGAAAVTTSLPAKAFEVITTPDDNSLADNVDTLYIAYVKDGELQAKVFSGEDLDRNKTINLGGYVVYSMVFTKDGTQPYVDKKPMESLEAMVRTLGKFDTGSSFMSTRRVGEKIKIPVFLASLTKILKSDYFNLEYAYKLAKNKTGPGTIDDSHKIRGFWVGEHITGQTLWHLTNDENIELVFNSPQGLSTVNIKQEVHKVDSREGIDVLFVGNRKERIKRRKIKKATNNVFKGISEINKLFYERYVNTLILLDLNDEQACSDTRNGEITFTLDYMQKRPLNESYYAARHETIHKIVNKYGLDKNQRVEKFHDKLGSSNGYDIREYRERQEFFKFISERNVYGINGGHPQDTSNEFCTSFIHSTLDMKNVKRKLRKLRGNERKLIEQMYQNTLDLLIQESNGPLKLHLQNCRTEYKNA